MSKEKKINIRVSEEVKESITKRWKSLGFGSESEYIMALLKADIPGIDPARHLKGLDKE